MRILPESACVLLRSC